MPSGNDRMLLLLLSLGSPRFLIFVPQTETGTTSTPNQQQPQRHGRGVIAQSGPPPQRQRQEQGQRTQRLVLRGMP